MPGAAAGMHGQLQGLITSLSSPSSFYVGDQLVVTNTETHLVLQGRSPQAGLAVKVAGTFDASGALVAKEVQQDRHAP